MWPLPRIKNEHIQLTLHQQRITLTWIQPHNIHKAILRAYEAYEVPPCTQSLIYNTTALRKTINSFILEHKLSNAYLHIILSPEVIEEQIIAHHKSDASLNELIAQKKQHHFYSYRYVSTHDDQFLFYVSAAAQPLILQLNMINMQLPIHMKSISPPFHLQLLLYKQIFASSFNLARMAQEIDQEHVRIPSVFSLEFLRRSLKTDHPVTYDDHDLLYALGSFLGAIDEIG